MNLGRFIAVTAGLGLVTGAAACSLPVAVTGLVVAGAFYGGFRGLFVKDVSLESRPKFDDEAYVQMNKQLREAKEVVKKMAEEKRCPRPRCEQLRYITTQDVEKEVNHKMEHRIIGSQCERPPAKFYQEGDQPHYLKESKKPENRVYEYHSRPGKTPEGRDCIALCTPVEKFVFSGQEISHTIGYASIVQDIGCMQDEMAPMEKFADDGEMYWNDEPVFVDDPLCRPPKDIKGNHKFISKEDFSYICFEEFKNNPPPPKETKVTLDRPSAQA